MAQHTPQSTIGTLPESGFIRLPVVLSVFPVSKSAWWKGIKDGRFPAGKKIGPRTTAWEVAEIKKLLTEFN